MFGLFTSVIPLWLLSGISAATSQRPIHYLALGDSYAAGDGAGPKRLWPSDIACGRFSGAYTYQVLDNPDVAFASHWPSYENRACEGEEKS